jgi:hypothetical protein
MAVKWDLNLGTIVGLLPFFLGGAFYVNTQLTSLEARLNQSEQFRASRTAQTDANFVQLTSAVRSMQDTSAKQNADIGNLTYRMGQGEARQQESDKRMDRIADSVPGAVDSIKRDINGLNTRVELMTQKIDSLDVPRTPRPRS